MGWTNGLPISVGELAGQFIGFSNMGYGGGADFNVNTGSSGRYSTQQLEWVNTEFDQQIDISEYFTPGHADFDIELAGINIVDENKNVSARFVCRLSKSGSQWHLNNRLENPSGAVIAYIMRSQGGNVTLSYDQSGSYSTGIWKVYLALSVTTSGSDKGIAWVVNDSQCGSKYGNWYFGRYGIAGSGFHESQLWDTFGIAGNLPEPKVKSPEFGPSAQSGGGYNESVPPSGKGSFDDSSDIVTPSSKPTLSVLTSNLVHAYKVTTSILNDLADAMYPDYIFSNASIEDALAGIYNAIFFSRHVDFMLDLVILPIEVPAPTLVHIKIGGKFLKTANEAFIDAYMVQEQYVDFDCGSISIPEYWANFLDYAGTRVKLFLPYVGYVDIQPEFIIGGELSVKYRFNVLDGSFIIFVCSTSGKSTLEDSLIAQYSGVAAVHIPLQAEDYSQKVSGLISAIGGVAAGVAGSGIAGAVAASGIANAANTLIQKPGSSHANGYNASSAYLSHRKPYLLIERQTSQFSQKYPEEVGLPLNVMKTLGSCTGLTKAKAVHLDTIPATVEVKEKIAQLMEQGIIL